MNVFADVEGKVLAALAGLQKQGALPDGLDFGNVAVEQPRDASHGDLACNAAMVLAKAAKMKPRDIAERVGAGIAVRGRVRHFADAYAVEHDQEDAIERCGHRASSSSMRSESMSTKRSGM